MAKSLELDVYGCPLPQRTHIEGFPKNEAEARRAGQLWAVERCRRPPFPKPVPDCSFSKLTGYDGEAGQVVRREFPSFERL